MSFCDTSRLKVDMEFKSMKALAEFLGEKVAKSGRAREQQEKRWKKCFNFEKKEHSNKIRITEIYDNPISIENRGKKSQYISHFEKVLLYNLPHSSSKYVNLSFNQLWGYFDINYRLTEQEKKTWKEMMFSDENSDWSEEKLEWQLEMYEKRIGNILRTIAQSCLNQLKKKNVIEYEIIELIVKQDNNRHIVCEATDSDIEYMNIAKEKVLKSLEAKDYSEVIKKRKEQHYHIRYTKYIQNHYHWIHTYNAFRIKVVNPEDIDVDVEAVYESKDEMKRLLIERFKANAETMYQNSIKKNNKDLDEAWDRELERFEKWYQKTNQIEEGVDDPEYEQYIQEEYELALAGFYSDFNNHPYRYTFFYPYYFQEFQNQMVDYFMNLHGDTRTHFDFKDLLDLGFTNEEIEEAMRIDIENDPDY